MTEQNFRTRYPLNMSFNNFDARLGELTLSRSALFRSNGLKLLCGVSLSDVRPADDANIWHEQATRNLLDYLVCRDDGVLLAINVSDRDPCRGDCVRVPDLPTAETTRGQFEQGDVADILAQLDTILREGDSPVWYCRLQPYPAELAEQLFAEVLLETQANGNVAPTDYGMCIGLVKVLRNGRCSTLCTRQTAEWLPQFLQDNRPRVTPDNERLPFEEHLKAFRSGLLSNGQNGARLVQEVMDTPLEEYMDGFPEELATLRQSLSDQCTTYGEAAYTIYSMLHSPDEVLFDEGVALMRLLAAPPLEDRKIMNAMRLGRVSGRAPDRMPERYRRGGEVCEKQSFEACISRIRQQLPTSMKLTFGTQESFFQGVGVLAGSGYPQWLSGALRMFCEVSTRYKYVDLLDLANDWFRKEESRDFGIRLLYLLLIEPYRLIYNKFERNRKEVRKA